MQSVEVSVLRGFELRCDFSVVRLPLSGQRVIAFLALQRSAVERAYVAGTLWGGSSEERAAASLRTVLWRLPPPARALLNVTGGQLGLIDYDAVDLHRASERARSIIVGGSADPGDLVALASAGDVLPDWYEDWLLMERERFRQLRLHALEAICERLVEEGRYAEAVDAGTAAVAIEPLRESAHRVLIKAHVAEGNPAEAMRVYGLYSRLLRHQLGLEPSPSIRGLIPGRAGV